jgi:predicted dehydrogenase
MPHVTRRSLLASAAVTALAANAQEVLRLPRKLRGALIGSQGHPNEITGPLSMLPDVEMVAVADTDAQAMARLARHPRLAGAKQYADYRRLLDAEQLDFVAVCNSNGDRAAAVLACAERKLHFIAEKPLALTRASLNRIRKTVAENGLRISMLLPMRFSSPYLALKKIVESGEVGEVANIGAQKSYKAGDRPEWMKKRSSYGGTIPWIGIHMVDLMRWASGREFREAVSFQSQVGSFPGIGEMENTTATLFRLDNGGVGALRMDYFRPETATTHGDDRLRLAGTKGVVEYQAATGVTLIAANRKPETIRDLPPEGSVFIDFLDAAYNGKPASLSAEDIYRVNLIVIAAQEAAERHQIVSL